MDHEEPLDEFVAQRRKHSDAQGTRERERRSAPAKRRVDVEEREGSDGILDRPDDRQAEFKAPAQEELTHGRTVHQKLSTKYGTGARHNLAGRVVTDRRRFLMQSGSGLAVTFGAGLAGATSLSASDNRVQLNPVQAPSEVQERTPPPNDTRDTRIGYAVVGLGRLALGQILPALRASKHSRPVALVSGDRQKAERVARQYDVDHAAIYDYASFDRIASNPQIDVVYIVLPNSLHAEYTIRAARAGKHVLCEKPMATSAADCVRMINACERARRRLMIAYRVQYEPTARKVAAWVKSGRLGQLKEFVSANSQSMGDPTHWRLKRALAGGGPLPDVGLYCINTVRFFSGEEPVEVSATVTMNTADPRFAEVEESMQFTLRFPSGLLATCSTSYSAHKSQFLRLQGSLAWAEMDPAYAYRGVKARLNSVVDDAAVTEEPAIDPLDQFALEVDHMSECVRGDKLPWTPGEEGLQDQRIIEALYESARTQRPVTLAEVEVLRGALPARS